MTTALPFLPSNATPLKENTSTKTQNSKQNLAAAQSGQSQSSANAIQTDNQSSGTDSSPKDFSSWLSTGDKPATDKQPLNPTPAPSATTPSQGVPLEAVTDVVLDPTAQALFTPINLSLTSKQALHTSHFLNKSQIDNSQNDLSGEVTSDNLIVTPLIENAGDSLTVTKKDSISSGVLKTKIQQSVVTPQIAVDPSLLPLIVPAPVNLITADSSLVKQNEGSLVSTQDNPILTGNAVSDTTSNTGVQLTQAANSGTYSGTQLRSNAGLRNDSLTADSARSNGQPKSSTTASQLQASNLSDINSNTGGLKATLITDPTLSTLSLSSVKLTTENLTPPPRVASNINPQASISTEQLPSPVVTPTPITAGVLPALNSALPAPTLPSTPVISSNLPTQDKFNTALLNQQRLPEKAEDVGKVIEQALPASSLPQLTALTGVLPGVTPSIQKETANSGITQAGDFNSLPGQNIIASVSGGEKSADHNNGSGTNNKNHGRSTDKNSLVSENNGLTNSISTSGTPIAIRKLPMAYASQIRSTVESSLPLEMSSVRGAVLEAKKVNSQVVVTPVNTRAAVDQINKLVDTHITQSENLSKTINLGFKFGDTDVGLKVQVKDGTVITQFSTDSNEIRAALSSEWQSSSFSSKNHNFQFAEPTFTSTTGGNTQNPFNSENNQNPQYQSYDGSFAGLATPSNSRVQTSVPQQVADGDSSIQQGQLRTFA
jgi:hypothetical protein